MLDDFNQHNQEQPLDTLPESPALPWNKKIILLCLGIALIGLFIFFTSGSWSSEEHKVPGRDSLVQEVESLKSHIRDLEQQLADARASEQATPVTSTQTAATQTASVDPAQPVTPSLDNLKSLIEQELQQSSTTAAGSSQAPSGKEYVVKSGDNLSKISKQFYGTPHRWKKIVEANRDKLGHNQVLKPGMTLTIPAEA